MIPPTVRPSIERLCNAFLRYFDARKTHDGITVLGALVDIRMEAENAAISCGLKNPTRKVA